MKTNEQPSRPWPQAYDELWGEIDNLSFPEEPSEEKVKRLLALLGELGATLERLSPRKERSRWWRVAVNDHLKRHGTTRHIPSLDVATGKQERAVYLIWAATDDDATKRACKLFAAKGRKP